MRPVFNPQNVDPSLVPPGWRFPYEDELLPSGAVEILGYHQSEWIRPWSGTAKTTVNPDYETYAVKLARQLLLPSRTWGPERQIWGCPQDCTYIVEGYAAHPIRTRWPHWDTVCSQS